METNNDFNKENKKNYLPMPEELNTLGKLIVDAAFHVHKNLGPGLLEKVYEICFCYEIEKRGVNTPVRSNSLLGMERLPLMMDYGLM